tara:strand:- start:117 stop:269 length:153 start_codon:yes stop_codon:yes gene_type:complete
MYKSERVKKLMDLRRKNWSIEDLFEWMESVVYHTYEQDYIEECIKDEEEG